MADDYHIIGGMVAFIIVVLAIIGVAALEYPEITNSVTGPTGPEWPPRFPQWGENTPQVQADPACDAVVLCLNIAGWFFVQGFNFFLNIIFFIAGVIAYPVQLFIGLAAFAITGLPEPLAWLGIGIAFLFIIIFALIVLRFVLSAIPFVGA